jgi:hypothetical protein
MVTLVHRILVGESETNHQTYMAPPKEMRKYKNLGEEVEKLPW